MSVIELSHATFEIRLMSARLYDVHNMRTLKLVIFFLLATVVLGSGCLSERNEHVYSYNQQLALPNAHIQTYSNSYVRHKALCNPKDKHGIGNWHCEQMKADAASVQEAERQALPIYEQMENDPVLNEQDRELARQSVARLRADLEESNQ